jgi:hypothetical protein
MALETDGGRPWGAVITPDTRWMTYEEAAKLLGVKTESIRRRAQRDGWPRQQGNDGKARVGVPGDVTASPDVSGATVAANNHPHPGEIAALRDALDRERQEADRLRAELEASRVDIVRERERADAQAQQLRAEILEQRSRADRAEGEVDGLKTSAEHLHEVAAQARREERAAQDRTAEALRRAEDADRKAIEARQETARLRARGLLARLRNRQ